MKVVGSKSIKGLRPVATLKKLGSSVYDEAYKLYRIGSVFCIIRRCMAYNNGCGFNLAFEEKDLKEASCGGYGGFDYDGKKYCCPNCGAENWIDTGIFPALLSLAKEKHLKRGSFVTATR